MKEFWCDLETTGVNPRVHGIWQIAFIIVDGSDRIESSYTLQNLPADKIDTRALELGGITKEQLSKFKKPRLVFEDIKIELKKFVNPYNKQDKFHFYGYNSSFDANFLRQFWHKMEDKFYGSWFWTPPIDVMSLAAYHLRERRNSMLDFKLNTVAKTIGIDIDDSKTHDALYDIQITREIMSKIEGR